MKEERISWVDKLRGIGFYFVILGHVIGINETLKSWIYSFHMPLFFFLSGFTMNREKMLKTSFKDYFIKLFKRMIVPYVWLELTGIIIKYIESLLITNKPIPVKGYLIGIFVGDHDIVKLSSAPMYFVLILFLAEIFMWVINKLTKGNLGLTGIIILFTLPISIMTQGKHFPWHITMIPTATCFLFLGVLLRLAYEKYKEKIHSLTSLDYVLITLVFFVFGGVIWYYNGRFSLNGNLYGENFFLAVITAVSTVCAFALISMKLPKLNVLSFIGKNTFFLMGARPIMLIMDTALRSYRSPFLYPLLLSVAQLLIMIPVTLIANKLWPYFSGKKLPEKCKYSAFSKLSAVFISLFVPFIYFAGDVNSRFGFKGIAVLIAEGIVYVIGSVAATYIIDYFLPVAFNQERRIKNNSLGKYTFRSL